MVRKEIDVNKPLTDAQIAMLQALADRPGRAGCRLPGAYRGSALAV